MNLRRTWRTISYSLRARLLLLSLLPALLITTVGGGYVLVQRAQDGRERLAQDGAQLARQLAAGADYGIFSGNRDALQRLAQSVAGEPSVIAASVHDAQGDLLAQGAASAAPGEAAWSAGQVDRRWFTDQPQALPQPGRVIFVQPVASPAVEVNDYAEPGSDATGRPLARGWVVVALSTQPLQQELARLAAVVLAAMIVALAIAVLFARRLSARISRPLRDLALAVGRVGEGAVAVVRVGHTRMTVINELAEGFNRMAFQIESAKRDLEDKVREATARWREQTHAAEAANKAKTKFLAAASHDLRQPMHALTMFIAALRQETDPGRSAQLLERVEQSVVAMGDLLDALLDISKLDAGKVQPQLQQLPVQTILHRLREQYEPLAEQQGLTLTVRNSPLWVQTDPLMLGRILGNFVSNAIRYTPPGAGSGQILVAVRRRGSGVCIEVRDSGIGIAPASQKVIFDEFVQLHNPQRDRGKGLGLGLAIVQRLAEILGHGVTVRSLPGQGSTFAVCLPVVKAPALAAPDVLAPPGLNPEASLQGLRVLIVEDDALVREGAERLLALWGCDIRSRADGQDLVPWLAGQGWKPQVIVTDYRLGGALDGIALVRSLRQAWGQAVPAVVVSGDTEVGLEQQAEREGVVILFKPIRPELLRQRIADSVRVVQRQASD